VAAAEGVRGGAEVRLQGLTKLFGPVTAVSDVSMTVPAGSFFTLLGPSGSGKTTTLMMVAGFVHPSRGSIAIDGTDVAGLPPQKRDLGMVFQSYAVFPHLTVAENIAFPLQVRKVSAADIRRRVGEALELVRLTGYERRFPRQLSGGEQQRVAIARAIAKRPAALLCDEPTGALDAATGIVVLSALAHANQELGTTTIVITHNMAIGGMADRVVSLADGRIASIRTNPTKVAPESLSW